MSVCPCCGYCPTCGRRNPSTYPYYPYTQPYTWSGNTNTYPSNGGLGDFQGGLASQQTNAGVCCGGIQS